MRSAGDAARIAHQQEVQAAQLAAQAQLAELHATVRHLRQEAETQKSLREQAFDDRSRSRSRDISQLQDTIVALRTALENHGR
jgi:signal transduction histidine kinase